jgi:hypothetical protein
MVKKAWLGVTVGSPGLSPITVTFVACNSTSCFPRDSLNFPWMRTLEPTAALQLDRFFNEHTFQEYYGQLLEVDDKLSHR